MLSSSAMACGFVHLAILCATGKDSNQAFVGGCVIVKWWTPASSNHLQKLTGFIHIVLM